MPADATDKVRGAQQLKPPSFVGWFLFIYYFLILGRWVAQAIFANYLALIRLSALWALPYHAPLHQYQLCDPQLLTCRQAQDVLSVSDFCLVGQVLASLLTYTPTLTQSAQKSFDLHF